MESPFSLAGETALISGGGTGLGLGIARCFVQAGARVLLVGRRAEVLKRAAQELGEAADWEQHDILQLDRAGELVKRAWNRVGAISILVNNAGIHIKKPAVELTPEEFHAVLQTHLVAAFSLTRAVLPDMIERRHGNILFSASMASLIGLPQVSAYSAAKAGHLGLVRSLASEVSPYGGRLIDEWLADHKLPTPTVKPDSHSSFRRTIRVPELRTGDKIRIEGRPDDGERAAIDYIEINEGSNND